jgi:hypothetical protein
MTGPRRTLAFLYMWSLFPLFACSAQVSGGGTGYGGAGVAGSSGQGGQGAGQAAGTTGAGGTTGVAGTSGTAGAVGRGGTTGTAGTTGTTGVAGISGGGGAPAPVDLTGRKALLLVDSPSSPSSGEVILQETLQERGMVVTIGASTGPASLATGQNVIVVSDSSGAGDFAPIFGTAAVPMIVFGNSAYQTLGWTASSSAKGTVDGTISVTVVGAGTPLDSDLAVGSSFPMILASQSSSLYWGTPGGQPIAVASVMGAATELIDFAYEAGSATASGTAPARRVGLGWKTSAIQNLTINGFKLLSAALDWTAGSH